MVMTIASGGLWADDMEIDKETTTLKIYPVIYTSLVSMYTMMIIETPFSVAAGVYLASDVTTTSVIVVCTPSERN